MSRTKRFWQFRSLVLLFAIVFGLCAAAAMFPDALETMAKSPQMASPEHVYKVVIDAGHGGKDPGAAGASGREEKEFTRALSQQIYELLKQEPMFDPYLTRSDDTFIALQDRALLANDLDADALISIHGNTYADPDVGGTETYYFSADSKPLAQALHEHLIQAQGSRDRGVGKYDWTVLTYSEVPAVLTEVGYLTNPGEEAVMWSADGQRRTAEAIVDGFKQYFTENPKRF
ncbi:N-acetylmuramoyl-L-alanine amidase [Brevibacillus sp. B_LB10_24]|uniref:N-acetylmuramoyl-L-alanine amidase family protein n=1 Tax=Brevibacillus sp. B_LB10_24 TaxID=3380645 RepID=UPI0038B7BD06